MASVSNVKSLWVLPYFAKNRSIKDRKELTVLVLLAMVCQAYGNCNNNNNCTCFGQLGGGDGESKYVFVGERLTLNCTLEPGYSFHQISITRGDNETIDAFVTNVNPHLSQLNMTIAFLNDSTKYECWCDRNGTKQLIGGLDVEVEYHPQKVKDLSCVVNNWDTMTCTWDLGVEYKNISNVDVEVIWNASGDWSYYYGSVAETKTSCYWSEEDYHLQQSFILKITVKNIKRNISVTSRHDVIADNHVKPGKVDGLQYDTNSTCASFRWTSTIYQLKYRVKYTTQAVNRTIFCYGNSCAVCNLNPFTNYTFSFVAKPQTSGYWSDPVWMSITTAEDVPAAGPAVTNGSYFEHQCRHGFRNVTLHIKAPRTNHQNGVLKNYTVIYRSTDSATTEKTIDALQTYVNLHLKCDVDYQVQLYASTQVGRSRNFTTVKIYKEGAVVKPRNCRIEKRSGGDVMARWEPSGSNVQRSQHYTVYWCAGNRYRQTCQVGFQWLKVPVDRNNVSLPVNVTDVGRKVNLFGVSLDSDHGSSGLAWIECIYSQDAIPSKMPPVKLASSSPDLSLTVTWTKIDMCKDEVLINGFIVDYCQNNADDGSCYGPIHTKVVRNTETSYVIHGLKANVGYRITVKARSTGGTGHPCDSVLGIPVETRLKIGHFVTYGFGAAFGFVFMVAGFVWIFRCSKRGLCKPIPITLPSGVTEKISDPFGKHAFDCNGKLQSDSKVAVLCLPPPTDLKPVSIADLHAVLNQNVSSDSGHYSIPLETEDRLHSLTSHEAVGTGRNKTNDLLKHAEMIESEAKYGGMPPDYSTLGIAESTPYVCVTEITTNNETVRCLSEALNPDYLRI